MFKYPIKGKNLTSHPSHPCALQYKASSYPGSPSNTLPLCLYVCSCVCRFTLRAYLFAHISLCLYVSLATSYLSVMPQPALGRRHLSGSSLQVAEVAQPPLKSRKLIAENASSCRIWRPCLASRLLRKRAADMKETLKLVKSTSRAFFLLDWQRSVCNTLKNQKSFASLVNCLLRNCNEFAIFCLPSFHSTLWKSLRFSANGS